MWSDDGHWWKVRITFIVRIQCLGSVNLWASLMKIHPMADISLKYNHITHITALWIYSLGAAGVEKFHVNYLNTIHFHKTSLNYFYLLQVVKWMKTTCHPNKRDQCIDIILQGFCLTCLVCFLIKLQFHKCFFHQEECPPCSFCRLIWLHNDFYWSNKAVA